MLLTLLQNLIEMAQTDPELFKMTLQRYLLGGLLSFTALFTTIELLFFGVRKVLYHLTPNLSLPYIGWLATPIIRFLLMPLFYAIHLIIFFALSLWLVPQIFSLLLI